MGAGICKVGPAYLNEGNRPKLLGKEEGCVLAKIGFFFLSLQILTKILAGNSFLFYSLDTIDTTYQGGLGKVTLLLCFPSFRFLAVSPITLSSGDIKY